MDLCLVEDANRVTNGLVASGGRDSDKSTSLTEEGSSAHPSRNKWLLL